MLHFELSDVVMNVFGETFEQSEPVQGCSGTSSLMLDYRGNLSPNNAVDVFNQPLQSQQITNTVPKKLRTTQEPGLFKPENKSLELGTELNGLCSCQA